MTDCNVDCRNTSPEPSTWQSFSSNEVTIGGLIVFQTSWTIFADNPEPEITLNCPALSPNPVVTKCEDGSWTVPEAIKETCGSSGSGSGGMMDHGSGSGSEDDGMMDHGSSSGSEDDGMMDHGSGNDGMMDHGSGNDGMMDHGSGSGSEDDGMMDHGSSSGSEDDGMMDHGSGA